MEVISVPWHLHALVWRISKEKLRARLRKNAWARKVAFAETIGADAYYDINSFVKMGRALCSLPRTGTRIKADERQAN